MLRPLLRFRLRSLFITMSVLAAVAAFVARPIQAYRQERAALSEIPGSRRINQEPLAVQPNWALGKISQVRIPAFF